jgi:hypothetical protein
MDSLPNANKSMATEITMARLRLRLDRSLPAGEAPALHCFFSSAIEEALHRQNQGPKEELVYQYPRIQFKTIERWAYLLGINEGIGLLEKVWSEVQSVGFRSSEILVVESQFTTETETIVVTPEPIEYRFATPWLALNLKNFQEYTRSTSRGFRIDKLNRTLIGNVLGMCKSLGIRLSDHIQADCSKLSSFKTMVNGQATIGFVGQYRINLDLPDFLGLGKSTPRGFGTIMRVGRNK